MLRGVKVKEEEERIKLKNNMVISYSGMAKKTYSGVLVDGVR